MDKQPIFGILAGEIEIIGERCKDGGKCHHGCVDHCSRQQGCVPLSGSGLNDDWSEPSAALSASPAPAGEVEAVEVVGAILRLEPCPFCGRDLEVAQRKFNPYARCATEGCKGGRLPLLNLDMPGDIEAWNTRPSVQAVGTCDPAAKDAEIARLQCELETERARLAACGVAALGYFDGCVDEYRSASLNDVLQLRAQLAAQQPRYGCDYAGCSQKAHPGTSLCLEHHTPKNRAALAAQQAAVPDYATPRAYAESIRLTVDNAAVLYQQGRSALGYMEDIAGWAICIRDRMDELLAAPAAPQQGVDELRKDAERWRAFINCARIKFFGWAGYTNPDPNGNDPKNYRHFGAEFWTIHDAPTSDKEQARTILNGFADAAIGELARLNADRSAQGEKP